MKRPIQFPRFLDGARGLLRIDSTPPLPPFLYKYRTGLESYLDRAIVHSEIYYPGFNSVNDIFDGQSILSVEGTPEQRAARIQRMFERNNVPLEHRSALLKQFDNHGLAQFFATSYAHLLSVTGVYSATTDPRNPVMWAQYAGNNTGVCLQYYTPASADILSGMTPVRYSAMQPTVNWHDSDFGLALIEALMEKDLHWQFEQEWRLLSKTANTSEVLRPYTLAGVIYGHACTVGTKHQVREMLAKRQAIGGTPVMEWQAVRSHRYRNYGIFPVDRFPSNWIGRPRLISL
jgi:hypothetical protein